MMKMKICINLIALLLLLSCSAIDEGNRALRCERKGYMKNAELHYLRALDDNPNPEDYNNIAKFYTNNSNYDKAKSVILSGLQKFPQNVELNYLAGSIYYNYSNDLDSTFYYINKANLISKTHKYEEELISLKLMLINHSIDYSKTNNFTNINPLSMNSLRIDEPFVYVGNNTFMNWGSKSNWINVEFFKLEYSKKDSILHLNGKIITNQNAIHLLNFQILIGEFDEINFATSPEILGLKVAKIDIRYKFFLDDNSFDVTVKLKKSDTMAFVQLDRLDFKNTYESPLIFNMKDFVGFKK